MSMNFVMPSIGSLSSIGSTKSIPYILPLLKNTKGEVRRSAVCAIDTLGGATFLPLYVKSYALLAIKNHGDETAIEVVYNRVKTVLSKKRKIESDVLIPAFEVLNQYKNHHIKIQNL